VRRLRALAERSRTPGFSARPSSDDRACKKSRPGGESGSRKRAAGDSGRPPAPRDARACPYPSDRGARAARGGRSSPDRGEREHDRYAGALAAAGTSESGRRQSHGCHLLLSRGCITSPIPHRAVPSPSSRCFHARICRRVLGPNEGSTMDGATPTPRPILPV